MCTFFCFLFGFTGRKNWSYDNPPSIKNKLFLQGSWSLKSSARAPRITRATKFDVALQSPLGPMPYHRSTASKHRAWTGTIVGPRQVLRGLLRTSSQAMDASGASRSVPTGRHPQMCTIWSTCWPPRAPPVSGPVWAAVIPPRPRRPLRGAFTGLGD